MRLELLPLFRNKFATFFQVGDHAACEQEYTIGLKKKNWK